jgi:hypothetical protein
MLRQLSRLSLFAVLVLQMALADSIPPLLLIYEPTASSKLGTDRLALDSLTSRSSSRSLGGDFFKGSGHSALRLNGEQESRLPTLMIFVPLGDSQHFVPYGSRVRPSKSFADRVLDVLFKKKGEDKPKH